MRGGGRAYSGPPVQKAAVAVWCAGGHTLRCTGVHISIRVHISALRKKLRAALGYDPIRNRIGEGYLMGGDEA